jgi:tetratricopeptide (TPR) repeat protein
MAARAATCTATGAVIVLLWSATLTAQANKTPDIRVHSERAQQALKNHQLDLAAEEFRQILRIDPASAEAHANLGLIAFDEGKYEDAAQAFQNALKLRPLLWNAQAYFGMTQLRLGKTREATALLEGSFNHLQDEHVRVRAGMDLISIYRRSDQLDRAVDLLRALQKASAADPDTLYSAYKVYSDLAAHAVAGMLKNAPDSARMHEILGQAAEGQDDFAGAIFQYRKALEIDNRLPGVHFELGHALLSQNQGEPSRQQAQQEFEVELALDPASGESEYYLGLLYWLRSNPEEALRHYSRAVALLPNSPDPRIAMAKVLNVTGQHAKAVAQLLEAVRLDPDNDLVHYRLAQAYEKLGRKEEADRERAIFQKLRDSQASFRSLNQQVHPGRSAVETLEPSGP